MTSAAIQIINVCKTFTSEQHQRKKALSDLSLNVLEGEVFGFLGPNGAGKSTTIKLLMNFLRKDSGTISIMGSAIGGDEFRHFVGYLPEFPYFYEHLTARETLLLSGRLTGMTKKTLVERIPLLLKRMNLHEATNQIISSFSKGMKQRLGMANALVHDPKILILDEPMSGLDPLGRNLIKEIILQLKEDGKTVFFSSHILSDIEKICDRIGIIHRGKLLYSGDIASFKSNNEDLENCFVSLINSASNASSN